MAISVACDCGKTYKVGDDKAGKRFRCKECGEPLRVPENDLDDDWGDDEWGDDSGEEDDYEAEPVRPRRTRSSTKGKGKGKGKKSKQTSGSNTMVFVAIGAVVLVLAVGAGLYFAFSGGDDDQNVAQNDGHGDDGDDMGQGGGGGGAAGDPDGGNFNGGNANGGNPNGGNPIARNPQGNGQPGGGQPGGGQPGGNGFGGMAPLPIKVPAEPIAGTLNVTSYLGGDSVTAILARPSRALKSPIVNALPINEGLQQAQQQTGLDFSKLETVAIVSVLSDANAKTLLDVLRKAGPPPRNQQQMAQWGMNMGESLSSGFNALDLYLVFAQFEEGVDLQSVIANLGGMGVASSRGQMQVEEVSQDGIDYLRFVVQNQRGALFMPDKRTVVLGGEQTVLNALAAAGQSTRSASPLLARIAEFGADRDLIIAGSIGDRFNQPLTSLESMMKVWPYAEMMPPGSPVPTPEAIHEGFEAIRSFQSGAMGIDLSGEQLLSAQIEMNDPALVAQMATQVRGGMMMATLMWGQAKANAQREGAPEEMLALVDQMLQNVQIESQENVLTVSVPKPERMDEIIGGMVAEGVNAGRQAARITTAKNKLKQIMLAFHNHHEVHQAFPPTGNQSRELSWRVHLLPFLDERPLYDQFHLDEPWDSPHNKALLVHMPRVYANVNNNGAEPGMTSMMGFSGPNTPFGGPQGIRFRDAVDGASNTIMIVHAGPEKAVPWTKPEDLPFNPTDPAAALGTVGPAGLLVAFMDGSVMALKNLDAEALKGFITHNGGEAPSERR